MFLSIRYDTFAKKYNSYGLKNIIKQENLERIDRVAYDASQIRFNYKNPVEWVKIKEIYNNPLNTVFEEIPMKVIHINDLKKNNSKIF
jgi:hypothetical protein